MRTPRGLLTVVLLLPLFFTYSGLNTRVNLVDGPQSILVGLQILADALLFRGLCARYRSTVKAEQTIAPRALAASLAFFVERR